MASGTPEREGIPNFHFENREVPYQKITIKKMPDSLFKELEKRAASYTLSVPVYCRAVLENAVKAQHDFKGPVKPRNGAKPIAEEINIPVIGKDFLKELDNWRPYGHRVRSKMVLAILLRHLEVYNW